MKKWIVFDFAMSGYLLGLSVHLIATSSWWIVGLNMVAVVLLSIGGIDRLNTIYKDK